MGKTRYCTDGTRSVFLDINIIYLLRFGKLPCLPYGIKTRPIFLPWFKVIRNFKEVAFLVISSSMS